MGVKKVVKLLKLVGDGVDFDWRHTSNLGGSQREIVGKTILALRTALNQNGLQDKHISYTDGWNCFWGASPYSSANTGVKAVNSDGECLDTLQNMGGAGPVSWINIMMYDVPPQSAFPGQDYFILSNYKLVLQAGES